MNQVEQTEAYNYLMFNGIFSEEAVDALSLIKGCDFTNLTSDLIVKLDSYIKASRIHNENDDHVYDPYDSNPFKDSIKVSMNDVTKCTISISANTSIDNDCAICMSEPDNPVSVTCGHIYCNQCITQWITNCKATCPLCNADISQ